MTHSAFFGISSLLITFGIVRLVRGSKCKDYVFEGVGINTGADTFVGRGVVSVV